MARSVWMTYLGNSAGISSKPKAPWKKCVKTDWFLLRSTWNGSLLISRHVSSLWRNPHDRIANATRTWLSDPPGGTVSRPGIDGNHGKPAGCVRSQDRRESHTTAHTTFARGGSTDPFASSTRLHAHAREERAARCQPQAAHRCFKTG